MNRSLVNRLLLCILVIGYLNVFPDGQQEQNVENILVCTVANRKCTR